MNNILHTMYTSLISGMFTLVFLSPIILIVGLILIIRWSREKKASEDISTILNCEGQSCVKCGSTNSVKPRAYLVCYSFLVISSKSPSKFMPICENCKVSAGRSYTLLSLLLGWWGIPWGPIYTLQAIEKNNNGGIVLTKDDIKTGDYKKN